MRLFTPWLRHTGVEGDEVRDWPRITGLLAGIKRHFCGKIALPSCSRPRVCSHGSRVADRCLRHPASLILQEGMRTQELAVALGGEPAHGRQLAGPVWERWPGRSARPICLSFNNVNRLLVMQLHGQYSQFYIIVPGGDGRAQVRAWFAGRVSAQWKGHGSPAKA